MHSGPGPSGISKIGSSFVVAVAAASVDDTASEVELAPLISNGAEDAVQTISSNMKASK